MEVELLAPYRSLPYYFPTPGADMERMRGILLVSFLAASIAIVPGALQARTNISVNIGPPPPIVEVVPPPRPGWVWAPGYWEWNGHRHVWVDGRWLHARHGYIWEPPHWVERHGRWYFEPGHWARG
jgi:hypothetical protein